MNKFNLDSAKFVSIIIGICFIFVMVIWHAFNYLPSKDGNNFPVENVSETRIEDQETVSEESSEESEVEAQEENQEEVRYVEQDIPQLEPIDRGNDVESQTNEELEQSSPFVESLNKAKEYVQENKIQNAILEYQKAISLTSDLKEKAQCYEEIALLYAQAKRYGSALSVAQKAYNTSPNTSREVLLARLYYKTGDIDKATNRVNNVLRRDFLKNDK